MFYRDDEEKEDKDRCIFAGHIQNELDNDMLELALSQANDVGSLDHPTDDKFEDIMKKTW